MNEDEAVDIVYTWVDDSWPGYRDEVARHAGKPADADPARTRDNLDLFRYSLRSLEPLPSWVGKVYLLSCRPQVPRWLKAEHPQFRVVHHDEIMASDILPTFNSFAIVSHLHLLPGISKRFIYFEDDILMRSRLDLADLIDDEDRMRLFPWKYWEPRQSDIRKQANVSVWNMALAHTGALLDTHFKPARRRQITHCPKLIIRDDWRRMTETFRREFAVTRASKFRGADNIVPEHLYPWMLQSEGKAVLQDMQDTDAISPYVSLTNSWLAVWWRLLKARGTRARWVNLNDDFGPEPSRISCDLARRKLEAWYPQASRFEK